MKFTCVTCNRTLSKSYAVDPESADLLGLPWYMDDSGIKHLAVVCLHCGTIHDASGSVWKALASGFRSPLKVHDDLNPMELSMLVMQHTDHPETESRSVAINDLGIPEVVIDVLVERKILGHAYRKQRA